MANKDMVAILQATDMDPKEHIQALAMVINPNIHNIPNHNTISHNIPKHILNNLNIINRNNLEDKSILQHHHIQDNMVPQHHHIQDNMALQDHHIHHTDFSVERVQ